MHIESTFSLFNFLSVSIGHTEFIQEKSSMFTGRIYYLRRSVMSLDCQIDRLTNLCAIKG